MSTASEPAASHRAHGPDFWLHLLELWEQVDERGLRKSSSAPLAPLRPETYEGKNVRLMSCAV